ncbi:MULTISPECIES: SGNH/GDSL hydrolase family protein [Hymenobacter]|uniref:SGNH hydrolase-type esterase domain-containing protein n=1 Tax=Hymenobacter jejuensis TaxID=2502781 RepID=A0A5B7ZV96_9BACT|nr:MULTISPECIES: SGNH/GDSL hydrolase family protein [Hymenobacter]MBC6988760.1 SGNH/GDSL hydrolase family protein [Hymenobacter sp. BT491]QDA58928.1 hypothetical protein FHG12_01895 [Hymenobacter jejuensis]
MLLKFIVRCLLFVFPIWLMGCTSKEPAPVQPLTYKVTLAGNSLLSGYLGFIMDEKIMTDVRAQAQTAGLGSGDLQNVAVANQTTQQILDKMERINAAYDDSKDVNVLVLWEGTNHIYYGAKAAQAEDALLQVCRQALAVHPKWKIVVGTLLPRSEEDTPANQETDRQATNAYLRNLQAQGSTAFHGLADVAADQRVGRAGDEQNTAYYHDRVHLNDAGQRVVAPIFSQAIVQAIQQVKSGK